MPDDRGANEQSLEASEARQRGFLEAALDCVIMIDAAGRVVEFNPAAERTFGYRRADVVGRILGDLIVPPSLREQHRDAFDRFVISRQQTLFGVRVQLTGMRSDGSEFPVELALSQVEGEPLLVFGALRDLTEVKQAEETLRRLADEQATLRAVATLVAEGAAPTEVFAAVAEGVARVLGAPAINMIRFGANATATKVAGWGAAPFEVDDRWKLDSPSLMASVYRTGRTTRIDDYSTVPGSHAERVRSSGMTSGVGVPIIVGTTVWGAMIAFATGPELLAADAGQRLERFTELIATAISNLQARDELRMIAEEQAALRRVTLLVARAHDSAQVFHSVCAESGRLVDAARVTLTRYTADHREQVMASWRADGQHQQQGASTSTSEDSISARISSTGSSQRFDSSEHDPLVRSEVDVPIMVDGRRWGALVAQLRRSEVFASTAPARVAMFADVVAIAVGNAKTKEDLLASRRRLVHAGDDARRKLGRDLHDGAQQRLVYSLMNLQLADERANNDQEGSRELLRAALSGVREGLDELRDLAAGLHPTILTSRGLEAAIDALAERSAIPVSLNVSTERYAPHLEADAYFIVAEGLTNIAKHARATHIEVLVREHGEGLDVEVRDDGCGGVNIEVGTGLRGLTDRIAAVGGEFSIESPVGQGTRLHASLPISLDASTS